MLSLIVKFLRDAVYFGDYQHVRPIAVLAVGDGPLRRVAGRRTPWAGRNHVMGSHGISSSRGGSEVMNSLAG